jgi:hypothetical protein
MKYKKAILVAAAIIFCVGGVASASTVRDITTKVGGKVGELLKINGSFWVTKNVKIDGKLTVNKRNVAGTKKYSGQFDTSATGDFVSTMTFGTDCSQPNSDAYGDTYALHYKKINIAEVKTSALPDIRLYYKYQPYADASFPGTYTPSRYPNSDSGWTTATPYLTNGKLYFMYKEVDTTCGGTVSTSIFTTGDYQVVIN